MSSIYSNTLPSEHLRNFDYSAMGKKQSSSEQGIFDVSTNDQSEAKQGNVAAPQKSSGQALFEQNLYEAVSNANKAASAASKEESAEEKDISFNLVEAAITARAVAYQLACKDKELNGGGGEGATTEGSAKTDASANAGVGGQKVSSVAQGLAGGNSATVSAKISARGDAGEKTLTRFDVNEEVLEILQEKSTKLDGKKNLDGYAEKAKTDNSNNENIANPLMYAFAQDKGNIEQKNNKQNADLYGKLIADNASGKNINANSGKPLDIIV